ncbi:hypothetical protein B7494_g3876 [Chlorociboria aeruginascens]|nr:hypothetical protein B7494_g3876 [Chlorociboria aeruginascens]
MSVQNSHLSSQEPTVSIWSLDSDDVEKSPLTRIRDSLLLIRSNLRFSGSFKPPREIMWKAGKPPKDIELGAVSPVSKDSPITNPFADPDSPIPNLPYQHHQKSNPGSNFSPHIDQPPTRIPVHVVQKPEYLRCQYQDQHNEIRISPSSRPNPFHDPFLTAGDNPSEHSPHLPPRLPSPTHIQPAHRYYPASPRLHTLQPQTPSPKTDRLTLERQKDAIIRQNKPVPRTPALFYLSPKWRRCLSSAYFLFLLLIAQLGLLSLVASIAVVWSDKLRGNTIKVGDGRVFWLVCSLVVFLSGSLGILGVVVVKGSRTEVWVKSMGLEEVNADSMRAKDEERDLGMAQQMGMGISENGSQHVDMDNIVDRARSLNSKGGEHVQEDQSGRAQLQGMGMRTVGTKQSRKSEDEQRKRSTHPEYSREYVEVLERQLQNRTFPLSPSEEVQRSRDKNQNPLVSPEPDLYDRNDDGSDIGMQRLILTGSLEIAGDKGIGNKTGNSKGKEREVKNEESPVSYSRPLRSPKHSRFPFPSAQLASSSSPASPIPPPPPPRSRVPAFSTTSKIRTSRPHTTSVVSPLSQSHSRIQSQTQTRIPVYKPTTRSNTAPISSVSGFSNIASPSWHKHGVALRPYSSLEEDEMEIENVNVHVHSEKENTKSKGKGAVKTEAPPNIDWVRLASSNRNSPLESLERELVSHRRSRAI